jgi:plastocyanin
VSDYALAGLVRAVALLTLLACAAAGQSLADNPGAASQRLRVTDAAGVPLANAVVWFVAEQSVTAQPPESATIDQIDKQFVPQVTVISTGTEVEFPNSDAVSHHVYSFAQPNGFELPLYKVGSRPKIRFEHPGIVTLGCNIHDTMLGYLVVVDSPYYAISNQDGYADFATGTAVGTEVFIWSSRLDPGQSLPADLVAEADGGIVVRAPLRMRPEPQINGGSLAWDDY